MSNKTIPQQGDIIDIDGISCVVIDNGQGEKKNGMSDKPMPKWGEIVHIQHKDHVVIEVGNGWVAVADRNGDQKDVHVAELDSYLSEGETE